MESFQVERLDYFGLIMSVIKDLRFLEMIDARLVPDEQEALTPGEAVVGMILNGLGFPNRPLSLTPPVFAHKPLALLLHAGVRAGLFNRFTLGRIRAEVYGYGCAWLLSELALAICTQEGTDLRFHHLDTTRFALGGSYGPERDEQAITLTHGYAKGHRPDLQQAVMVLKDLSFITRIPNTLKLVSHVITQAFMGDTWQHLKDTTRYHRIALCPCGMAQRWLVVLSHAALDRVPASIKRSSAKPRPVPSTSFTYKPHGLRRPRPPTLHWPRWRNRGGIITWPLHAKATPRPPPRPRR